MRLHRKIHLPFLFNLFVSTTLIIAQTPVDPANVRVNSWRKGEEKVLSQHIKVDLDSKCFEFEKEITAESGKKYRLSVIKNPDKSLNGEHWKVEFRQVVLRQDGTVSTSDDLLSREKPGDTGGDFFSRERFASFLYPYQEKRLIVGGLPLIEGNAFYPTKTIRTFLVDGFVLVISSGTVEFQQDDKTKIKSMELNIDLKNVTDL